MLVKENKEIAQKQKSKKKKYIKKKNYDNMGMKTVKMAIGQSNKFHTCLETIIKFPTKLVVSSL